MIVGRSTMTSTSSALRLLLDLRDGSMTSRETSPPSPAPSRSQVLYSILIFSFLTNSIDRDMVGGVLMAAYIDSIAKLFEKELKDEFIKQAVLDALPKKQVVFRPLKEKIPGAYQDVKVEDGRLVIGCVPGIFLFV